MAKTAAPGEVTLPDGSQFSAGVMPDPFDARDLTYRPRLQTLPVALDQRKDSVVLMQQGQACTGHALAAVINTILAHGAGTARQGTAPRVSPYMLYFLARRYDDFPGEADTGSSLRGALKGWFYHGVALDHDWPAPGAGPQPNPDNPEFVSRCVDRPLGAFYRVNPYRLDDMQSAIDELHGICASGVIHDGWLAPTLVTKGSRTLWVIARAVDSQTMGGHAFALVGYNEVGFLVQNSWGAAWGKNGFATLPYEDWLDCAYDAWVARPGVPKTPFATGRTQTAAATGGALSVGPGPDLKRLSLHVISSDSAGQLSQTGKFVSTPSQIQNALGHMGAWHDCWAQSGGNGTRHVVLYAHRGLTGEGGGLAVAQKHLNWWLNNKIYPFYFDWQSGQEETLADQIAEAAGAQLPAEGLGFDLMEQFDRLTERTARTRFAWLWEQVKQTARAASQPINAANCSQPPAATLFATELAQSLKAGTAPVAVHLVGHGAGAIFVAALLPRLIAAGLAIDSLALLAPALRRKEFTAQIAPLLGEDCPVKRWSVFGLSDSLEQSDTVSVHGVTPYHKSLLYLISRGLERPIPEDGGAAPLLGMEKFFDRNLLTNTQGIAVFAPATAVPNQQSLARTHAGFDDDAPTLTSVAMQALRADAVDAVSPYRANAALLPLTGRPWPVPTAKPLEIAAVTHPPNEQPLTEIAEPQTQKPKAPAAPEQPLAEAAVAPHSGSPVLDVLHTEGWTRC